MKVPKRILFETSGALSRLVEIEFEDEKLNYKLGRISDAATSILKPLLKSHDRLIKKHGKEQKFRDAKGDEQGTGQFYVEDDTPGDTAYQEEWGAILDGEGSEVQLTSQVDYKRIPLDALKPYMKRIKSRDLGALSQWLIEETGGE